MTFPSLHIVFSLDIRVLDIINLGPVVCGSPVAAAETDYKK